MPTSNEIYLLNIYKYPLYFQKLTATHPVHTLITSQDNIIKMQRWSRLTVTISLPDTRDIFSSVMSICLRLKTLDNTPPMFSLHNAIKANSLVKWSTHRTTVMHTNYHYLPKTSVVLGQTLVKTDFT